MPGAVLQRAARFPLTAGWLPATAWLPAAAAAAALPCCSPARARCAADLAAQGHMLGSHHAAAPAAGRFLSWECAAESPVNGTYRALVELTTTLPDGTSECPAQAAGRQGRLWRPPPACVAARRRSRPRPCPSAAAGCPLPCCRAETAGGVPDGHPGCRPRGRALAGLVSAAGWACILAAEHTNGRTSAVPCTHAASPSAPMPDPQPALPCPPVAVAQGPERGRVPALHQSVL